MPDDGCFRSAEHGETGPDLSRARLTGMTQWRLGRTVRDHVAAPTGRRDETAITAEPMEALKHR